MCTMRFLTDKSLKSHQLHTHVYCYNERGQVQAPFLAGPSARFSTETSETRTKLSHREKTLRFACPACLYVTYDHVYWEVHIQVLHGRELRYKAGRWFGWRGRR